MAGVFWPRQESPAAAGGLVSGKAARPAGAADAAPSTPELAEAPVAEIASTVAAERERMIQHVGEVFTVKDGRTATLVLEQVGELVRVAGQGRHFDGYSLLFKAGSGTPGEDGVYRLSHPALGELEFYLGSVCGPLATARYEAVISRAV
jgi:hypothetical protein